MATEGTLTDLRQAKLAELQAMILLLKDDTAIIKLKEEERLAIAKLEDIQKRIAEYNRMLGIGQPVAAPAEAGEPKERKTRGPRAKVDIEGLKKRILEVLKEAGPKGITVKELCSRCGFNPEVPGEYQRINNLRTKEKEIADQIEAVKDGVKVYLSLKSFPEPTPQAPVSTPITEAAKEFFTAVKKGKKKS